MLQIVLNLKGINPISKSKQRQVNGGGNPCWSGPGLPPRNIPICPPPPPANH